MPIYEYECPACGHRFDRLQKLSDPDPEHCPECAHAGVDRRVSAPAFRLSGGGWYETDFKSDKERRRNLVDRGDGDGGGKSDTPTGSDEKNKVSKDSAGNGGKADKSSRDGAVKGKPESKPAADKPASTSPAAGSE